VNFAGYWDTVYFLKIMTIDQIKFELEDSIKCYDDEIERSNKEGPPKGWTKTEEYHDHMRKTFITGIRVLIDHI